MHDRYDFTGLNTTKLTILDCLPFARGIGPDAGKTALGISLVFSPGDRDGCRNGVYGKAVLT